MASNTDNVKIGVCQVLYDNVNLGYTKGGVKVAVSTDTHEVKVDQFGESPISEMITARSVTVDVPLAETTLENLVKVMPGATFVSGGSTKASGTLTIVTNPEVDDTISVGGYVFSYETTISDVPATAMLQIKKAATAIATATATRVKISGHTALNALVSATNTVAGVASNVIKITADKIGVDGNTIALAASDATSIIRSGETLTGGQEEKPARVDVNTSIGANTLTLAKELRLRPLAMVEINSTAEDFVIPRAATAGALDFSYNHDNERIFNCQFKGYPDPATGLLFQYGHIDAEEV